MPPTRASLNKRVFRRLLKPGGRRERFVRRLGLVLEFMLIDSKPEFVLVELLITAAKCDRAGNSERGYCRFLNRAALPAK